METCFHNHNDNAFRDDVILLRLANQRGRCFRAWQWACNSSAAPHGRECPPGTAVNLPEEPKSLQPNRMGLFRKWSGSGVECWLLLVGPRRDRVYRGFHAIQSWLQAGVALLCTDCTLTLVLAHSHSHTHSCPPRRRLLDRSTCSGCTTRRCRVKASFLLNVFSSAHSGQCTFCFLAL